MSLKTYVDPRERENIRAHEGENVWVVLNQVHAEKREAFEHFLHEILMPAVAHVHPETYNKVRVLHPIKSNDDDTYTYIFLMDPVVADGSYEIENILYEYYKPEEVKEYMKVWEESLVAPQAGYDLVQSAW
jgi:hypothetical protein